MDQALQELIDKQAIRAVVLTYCRGIDRLDFDLVRSAYHPDAIDHHTGFDGTIDEYIAWATTKLSAIGGTMHHIGNHLVELHGDHAISEAYSMSTHWGARRHRNDQLHQWCAVHRPHGAARRPLGDQGEMGRTRVDSLGRGPLRQPRRAWSAWASRCLGSADSITTNP